MVGSDDAARQRAAILEQQMTAMLADVVEDPDLAIAAANDRDGWREISSVNELPARGGSK